MSRVADGVVQVVIETVERQGICPDCGRPSRRVKQRPVVRIRDLPVGGQQVLLCWRKRRLVCAELGCARRSFTQTAAEVPARSRLTLRLRRRLARATAVSNRAVAEVAAEYQVSWRTAHRALVAVRVRDNFNLVASRVSSRHRILVICPMEPTGRAPPTGVITGEQLHRATGIASTSRSWAGAAAAAGRAGAGRGPLRGVCADLASRVQRTVPGRDRTSRNRPVRSLRLECDRHKLRAAPSYHRTIVATRVIVIGAATMGTLGPLAIKLGVPSWLLASVALVVTLPLVVAWFYLFVGMVETHLLKFELRGLTLFDTAGNRQFFAMWLSDLVHRRRH